MDTLPRTNEPQTAEALPDGRAMVTIVQGVIARRNRRRNGTLGEAIILKRDTSGVDMDLKPLVGRTAAEEPAIRHFTGSAAEKEQFGYLFLLGALVTSTALRQGIAPHELHEDEETRLETMSRHIVSQHFESQTNNGSRIPLQRPAPTLALTETDLALTRTLYEGLEQQNLDAQYVAKVAVHAATEFFDGQPTEAT